MEPSSLSVPAKRPRGKRRWLKVVLSLFCILLLLIVAAGGTGYWMLDKTLPMIHGELKIGGLQAKVTVYRDANGVPHIEAQNDHDMYLAQGYVTAQDRLFQMDLSRRQASGELSEVVGTATVDRDKFFRTLGLRRAAEASLSGYSQDAKDVLNAYAEGVNDYIHEAKQNGTLPIEFRLMGYQPTDWSAVDSLTIGKYMAFDLGGHWESQVFRYYLAQKFPQDKALDLFPTYPTNAPTIISALKDNPLDLSGTFADAVIPNVFNGSNDWVVSGSKTASGKPILANDPHLDLATPSIWYETHLISPQTDVSGVIFAGIPGIILGHNQHIAWGVTNVGPDVQDLYIEKRNPQNKNQFEYMGKWETAQVIPENIKVKGGTTIPYQVVVTRHGPIISEFANDHSSDTALAMQWTALQPSTELEAVQQFAHATNWDEFKKALTYFDAPAQNFVFAGQDGTIAYRANGLIPIRKKGDGLTPVPGWTDEYEWKGYIPWEQLPTVVNPPEGYIATANNKVVTDSYPYHISNIWAEPYREERIKQVLSTNDHVTVKNMEALQFDHKNLQAQEFLSSLVQQLESNPSGPRDIDRQALSVLKRWNMQDEADLAGPLIWNLWMEKLPDVIFKPDISDEMYKMFEDKQEVTDELLRRAIAGKPGPWIQARGGLSKVALQSFQQAVDQAASLEGNTPDTWQWGRYHKIDFAHPLSAMKPLNLLFNATGFTQIGGSRVTVGAAGWNDATGEVDHGGAWRTVIDLTDLSTSYNVVGPGESGNVLSPWYHNQIGDWTTGRYHVTSTAPPDYRHTSDQLVLLPNS